MGNRNLEREATRAKTAYVAAVLRLARAMNAFADAHVPLEPDSSGNLKPWTREHVRVVRECAAAWPEVIEARRAYDAIVRDLRRPASRPYA